MVTLLSSMSKRSWNSFMAINVSELCFASQTINVHVITLILMSSSLEAFHSSFFSSNQMLEDGE
jgi:hypothetical protein